MQLAIHVLAFDEAARLLAGAAGGTGGGAAPPAVRHRRGLREVPRAGRAQARRVDAAVPAPAAASSLAVFGTTFQNPIILAAGTAGFGREVAGVIALERLGGLVTKAVSPEPRAGHPAPRVAEFAGGMLNAVGLANPGLERVAQAELPWLAGAPGADGAASRLTTGR